MVDRHMFRAEWHDYNDGIFFVTVCAKDKKHLFGTITNDEMHKNALGTIVRECIKAIPEHHPQVTIHNYVIMPNHIHLIIATIPCWQSRFHEHIIRNQRAFDNIMDYIDNNVARWEQDCFNLK